MSTGARVTTHSHRIEALESTITELNEKLNAISEMPWNIQNTIANAIAQALSTINVNQQPQQNKNQNQQREVTFSNTDQVAIITTDSNQSNTTNPASNTASSLSPTNQSTSTPAITSESTTSQVSSPALVLPPPPVQQPTIPVPHPLPTNTNTPSNTTSVNQPHHQSFSYTQTNNNTTRINSVHVIHHNTHQSQPSPVNPTVANPSTYSVPPSSNVPPQPSPSLQHSLQNTFGSSVPPTSPSDPSQQPSHQTQPPPSRPTSNNIPPVAPSHPQPSNPSNSSSSPQNPSPSNITPPQQPQSSIPSSAPSQPSTQPGASPPSTQPSQSSQPSLYTQPPSQPSAASQSFSQQSSQFSSQPSTQTPSQPTSASQPFSQPSSQSTSQQSTQPPPHYSSNIPPQMHATHTTSSAPHQSTNPPSQSIPPSTSIPAAPSINTIPAFFPPAGAPASIPAPVPSFPTPHHGPTSITAKDYQIVLKAFPKKATRDAYLQWKMQSLLTLSLHPVHRSITTRNPEGCLVLNQYISPHENNALYQATTTAFGDKASTYVDTMDHHQADGILLWQRLDSQIMGQRSNYNAQDLLAKYYQLKRQKNQSIESFGHSFMAQIEILSFNDIKVGTVKDRAFRFLAAVEMPKLFKEQIKDMDEFKDWWEHKTLREFIDRAIAEYHTEKRIGTLDREYLILQDNSNSNNNNNNTSDQSNNQRNNNNGNTNNTRNNNNNRNSNNQNNNSSNNNNNNNNNNTNPPNTSQIIPAHLSPAAQQFKSDLLANTSMYGSRSVLYKWMHANHLSCPFHNHTKTHNFLQCFVTSRICQETNNTNLLNEFKAHNGITDNNQPTQPTPPPHPQQPSNPYQPRQQFQRQHYTPAPSPSPAPAPRPAPAPAPRNPYTTVPNPYTRRTPPPPRQTNANVNARMTQVFNDRVEEEVNARVASYFANLQQEQEQPATEVEGQEQEDGFFEQQQEQENHTVVNDNNLESHPYSVFSDSKLINVVASAKYIPPSPTITRQPQHQLPSNLFKLVLDSGATDTLSAAKELFNSLTYVYDDDTPPPNTPHVVLGDDSTVYPIKGYGTICYRICGKVVRQFCYYVPKMGNITLLSVKQHSQYQGHYVHSENNTVTLAFPSFLLSLANDNEMHAIVTKSSSDKLDYDESKALLSNSPLQHTTKLISNNVKQYIPRQKQVSFQHRVLFKPLHRNTVIPKRATKRSIGYDIHSSVNTTLQPHSVTKVPTGVSMSIPNGLYCRIAPRSGLALKGISVEGGVVDLDYTGEYFVLLRNHTNNCMTVNYQQKIAQLIFEQASTPLIEVVDTLPSTDRNSSGFGSTDKNLTHQSHQSPNQLLPLLPPQAPPSKLVNRRQNQPFRKGGTSKTSSTPVEHLARFTQVDLNDIQFMSKIHPTQAFAKEIITKSDPPTVAPPSSPARVSSAEPNSVTLS